MITNDPVSIPNEQKKIIAEIILSKKNFQAYLFLTFSESRKTSPPFPQLFSVEILPCKIS